MSTLRNVIQRRNHGERTQPHSRKKLGILEKHRDYALRARNHHENKRRLQFLQQKAANRNPDEFHFGMINNKTDKTGRRIGHIPSLSLSTFTARHLKTQDAGHLRSSAAKARKDLRRLEENATTSESLRLRRSRNSGSVSTVRAFKRKYIENQCAQIRHSLDAQYELRRASHSDHTGKGYDDGMLAIQNRTPHSKLGESERIALRRKIQEFSAAEVSLDTERSHMLHSSCSNNRVGIKFKPRRRKK